MPCHLFGWRGIYVNKLKLFFVKYQHIKGQGLYLSVQGALFKRSTLHLYGYYDIRIFVGIFQVHILTVQLQMLFEGVAREGIHIQAQRIGGIRASIDGKYT